MSSDALKTIPEIISAASSTPLGILALLIVVLAMLGYFYFSKAKAIYQLVAFVLLFVGTAGFAWSVVQEQRADAIRAEAQLLPKLRLNLAFSGTEAANPYHAHVSVYVQPGSQSGTSYDLPAYLRSDIPSVPGPGGAFLEFQKLAVGDRVYVEVEDHGKKWHSYPMTMLEANLQLIPWEP